MFIIKEHQCLLTLLKNTTIFVNHYVQAFFIQKPIPWFIHGLPTVYYWFINIHYDGLFFMGSTFIFHGLLQE